MKVKDNVTVFQCEHCNKKLFRKHAMENHEKWCFHNPDNKKACADCSFLKSEKVAYTRFYFNGYYNETEENKESNGFRCTKKDKLLYPLKAEKKGLPQEYPETFADQEPMPKECDQFRSTYDDMMKF